MIRTGWVFAMMTAACGSDATPAAPIAPSTALERWVAATTAEFTVSTPHCRPGAELPAWRENPEWTPPDSVCTVDLDRGYDHRVSRLSESTFATAEAAAKALDQLQTRSDGVDPADPVPDKALVTGWVDGVHLYWVTTRASQWETHGCAVIAAFGPTTPKGTHRCG